MEYDPEGIVDDLSYNLERYPYSSGLTVFRELLQNADDAQAHTVALHLLGGWPAADNPLLRGPGLLLVNDGEFDAVSRKGMTTFGSSVKALDESAVGRFGLGQKSVFHICDAFVVIPNGYGVEDTPFVINPFVKLGQPGDDCLSWQQLSAGDADLIAVAGALCVPKPHKPQRLNLWLPLRRPDLRPKPDAIGIVATYIAPESLRPMANRWRLYDAGGSATWSFGSGASRCLCPHADQRRGEGAR